MAHSAVTLWKSCLKALQQLTADPSNKAAVESAVCDLFELLDDAAGLKDLPHATVKKLVNELQVPLHVCTACSKVAQHQPKTAGAYAAVSLMTSYLSATFKQCLPSKGTDTTLSAAVRRQMEQSGILQHLSSLLTAAAEELTAQAQDKSFVRYSQIFLAGAAPAAMYPLVIRHHAEQLLCFYVEHTYLCPTEDLELSTAALSTEAAMQLIVSVMQNVSAEVQEQQRSAGPSSFSSSSDMQNVMQAAHRAAVRFGSISAMAGTLQQHVRVPKVQDVLMSKHLVPCYTLMLSVISLSLRIQGLEVRLDHTHPKYTASSSSDAAGSSTGSTAAAGSSSGSSKKKKGGKKSSSSSNAASSSQQQPAALPGVIHGSKCPCCVAKITANWQLACDHYPSLTPCQHKLFEVLGVDGRTMLWAAACIRENCYIRDLGLARSPFIDHTNTVLRLAGARARRGDSRHIMPAQQRGLERLCDLLLPTVMLGQVAALPPGHVTFVELVQMTVPVCRATVAAFEALPPPHDQQQEQQQQQQEEEGSGVGEDPWQQAYPHNAAVDELMPLLCRLASGCMHHLHPASNSSSSSSSSATIGSRCSNSSCHHCQPPATFAQEAMPNLMEFLSLFLGQAFWSGAALDMPAPGDAAAAVMALLAAARAGEQLPAPQRTLHCVSSLRDHTAAALACAEGHVRYLAATISSQAKGSAKGSLMAVLNTLQEQVAGGHAVRPGPLLCLAIAAGPGSPEQRQLYSLLCSVLKLGREIGRQGLRQAWVAPAVMQSVTATTVAVALESVLTDAGQGRRVQRVAQQQQVQLGLQVWDSSSSSSR